MTTSLRICMRLLAASIGAVAILGVATPSLANEAHHTVVPGEAVKWGAPPPSLPPGAQASVLLGHPGQPGPFVLRLKFPAGFVVPPHRHSKDEMVTVIAGKFGIGSGETLDRSAAQTLSAGSFVHLPAGMPHFALAIDGEVIVQINGVGPFDVTYVNASDDPRQK
jgi:quercetin dioxygenase-like cupin family protein